MESILNRSDHNYVGLMVKFHATHTQTPIWPDDRDLGLGFPIWFKKWTHVKSVLATWPANSTWASQPGPKIHGSSRHHQPKLIRRLNSKYDHTFVTHIGKPDPNPTSCNPLPTSSTFNFTIWHANLKRVQICFFSSKINLTFHVIMLLINDF